MGLDIAFTGARAVDRTNDAAGNLLSGTGSALTYDAENRLTSATQSGIGSMYYSYDGAGRRVQEMSTYNTEKVFVYDAFGRLSAEYSTGVPAPPCTTCYIATDHLGSTRLVTDQNGNTVGRHDFVPFGEEIAANTGGRDSTFGTSDFVNQKFTGQERDVETGLDFFQARYFSAALGRFNSRDPENAGADLFNPQSWNGYTYVANNPLTLIDPSGLSFVPCKYPDSIACVGNDPEPGDGGGSGDINPGWPSDPCFFFNCWSGGFGYYGPPQQPVLPPPPPPPAEAPRILAKSVFTCASNSASKYSVAGGLQRFGIGTSGLSGFITNALGGNAFSGLTDLAQSFSSGQAGGSQCLFLHGARPCRRTDAGVRSCIRQKHRGNALGIWSG
jgi:RHS repeat-associated protein